MTNLQIRGVNPALRNVSGSKTYLFSEKKMLTEKNRYSLRGTKSGL